PEQIPGTRVEAQKVRVVGLQKHPRVPDGHATVVMLRCVIDQSLGDGAGVMPNDAPGLRVEGVGVIRGSYEHYSFIYDGSDLERARIRCMKNPIDPQVSNIAFVDLL